MSLPADWKALKAEHPTKVLMYRDDTTHQEDMWWVFNEDVPIVRAILRWDLVLELGDDVICCGVPESQCTGVVMALRRTGKGVVHVIKSVRRLPKKLSLFGNRSSQSREGGEMSDRPLQVEVEGGELVVRIGIDRLAWSAERCELLRQHSSREFPPYVDVEDAETFANEVAAAISKPRDDGETPLDRLLDESILSAMNDGSVGLSEASYPRPKRSPKRKR